MSKKNKDNALDGFLPNENTPPPNITTDGTSGSKKKKEKKTYN